MSSCTRSCLRRVRHRPISAVSQALRCPSTRPISMALASAEFLGPIVAAEAPDAGGLDRLAVDNPGARLGLTPVPDPFAQQREDPLPGPVAAPLTEGVTDRLPGRKVAREQLPLTVAAQDVEDAVTDEAQQPFPRSPARFRRKKQWCKQCPLGIGEVAPIATRRWAMADLQLLTTSGFCSFSPLLIQLPVHRPAMFDG